MALRTPTPPLAPYIAQLTDDQRARLDADADLRAAFEAGLAPFLPKPVGVSWSGSEDRWVPVEGVFKNASNTVRWARRDREIAA